MAKTDYSSMSIEDLRATLADVQKALDGKIEARRAELMEELESLGGFRGGRATQKLASTSGPTRREVKTTTYKTPDGSTHEYSGRGQLPKWASALGIKNKSDLEQYRVK